MSLSADFTISDFPHKVLDPIATDTTAPSYASLLLAQRQLGTNASAIPSHQRVTNQIYKDQPGRFLTPSSAGHNNMLVLYDYDSNAIHVELLVADCEVSSLPSLVFGLLLLLTY
jgi:hypothetical protein